MRPSDWERGRPRPQLANQAIPPEIKRESRAINHFSPLYPAPVIPAKAGIQTASAKTAAQNEA